MKFVPIEIEVINFQTEAIAEGFVDAGASGKGEDPFA